MSEQAPEPQPEPEAPSVGQSEWDLLAEIRDLLRELLAETQKARGRKT